MTSSFASAMAPYLPTYRATARVTPTVEVDPERLDERDRRRRAVTALKRQSDISRNGRPTLSILI